MITPKEKAKQLVEKFGKDFEFFHRDERGNTAFKKGKLVYPNQKESAIMCCDEILRTYDVSAKVNFEDEAYERYKETVDFWERVKEEIKNL